MRRNSTSTVNKVRSWSHDEDRYRLLLPPEVVKWCLEEAPVPFTFISLWNAYCSGSGTTEQFLEALKGAMAIDLRQVLESQGVDPSNHPYLVKYG